MEEGLSNRGIGGLVKGLSKRGIARRREAGQRGKVYVGYESMKGGG